MSEHDSAERDSAETRVAAAVAKLTELDARPLAEHAAAYARLHEQLQGELAEIDGS